MAEAKTGLRPSRVAPHLEQLVRAARHGKLCAAAAERNGTDRRNVALAHTCRTQQDFGLSEQAENCPPQTGRLGFECGSRSSFQGCRAAWHP